MGNLGRIVLSYGIAGGMFASGGGILYYVSERDRAGDLAAAPIEEGRSEAAPGVGGPAGEAGLDERSPGGVPAVGPQEGAADDDRWPEWPDADGFGSEADWGGAEAPEGPEGPFASGLAEAFGIESGDQADVEDGEGAGPSDEGEVIADPEQLLASRGFTRDGINYILPDEEARVRGLIKQATASQARFLPLVSAGAQVAKRDAELENLEATRHEVMDNLKAVKNDLNSISGRYYFDNNGQRRDYDRALARKTQLQGWVDQLDTAIRRAKSQLPDREQRQRHEYEFGRRAEDHRANLGAAREQLDALAGRYESRASAPEVQGAIAELRGRPDQKNVRIHRSDELGHAMKRLVAMEEQMEVIDRGPRP